jgi:heat shock protein HslJ
MAGERYGIAGMAVFAMLGLLITSGCMAPVEVPLNGTAWRLLFYDNGSSMTNILKGTIITVEFTQEGVAGSAGCNHYFASYTAGTSSLHIEDIGITEMYCTTPGVMDQESTYLAFLGTVEQYSVSQNTLTLRRKQEGTPRLRTGNASAAPAAREHELDT